MGVFADGGIVDRVANLLDLMAAFFIAALAAVATFERQGLDDKMKGEPAFLKVRRMPDGQIVDRELTRRQFVCYLFGYLAFAALLIFIALRFGQVIAPGVMVSVPQEYMSVISLFRFGFLSIFLLFFWQLVVTMLLGIYFLVDRLQFMDDTTA